MRAVLDSNVLARATYSVGGPAEELVQRLAIAPHALILSAELLIELRRVLRYPRLRAVHKFDDERSERSVTILESVAELVSLSTADIIRIVPHDPDDDHVVAAAVIAKANVLCMRNKHFYHESVVDYCRQHEIEILDDIELLQSLIAMPVVRRRAMTFLASATRVVVISSIDRHFA